MGQLPGSGGPKGCAALCACLLSADRDDRGDRQLCAETSNKDAQCSSGSAAAGAAAGAGTTDGQGPIRAGAPDGEGFGDDFWVPDSYPVASVEVAVHAVQPDEAALDQAPPAPEATPLREVPQIGEQGFAASQGASAQSKSGDRARSAAYMERRISAMGRSARKPEAPGQQVRAREPAPAGEAGATRTFQRTRKHTADGAAPASNAGRGSVCVLAAEGAAGSRAGAGANYGLAPQEERAGRPVRHGVAAEGGQALGRSGDRNWVSAWVTEVATTVVEPGAAAADRAKEGGAAAAPERERAARLASGQLPSGSRAARRGRLQALLAQAQQQQGGAGGERRAGSRLGTAVRRQPKGRAARGTGSRAKQAARTRPAAAAAAACGRAGDAGCASAAAADAAAKPAVTTATAVQRA